jgi:hypothetical protein
VALVAVTSPTDQATDALCWGTWVAPATNIPQTVGLFLAGAMRRPRGGDGLAALERRLIYRSGSAPRCIRLPGRNLYRDC